MKISIGLRLFLTVLISISGVISVSMLLMGERMVQSFSDYAVRIELDRLQGFSEYLQSKYQDQSNWSFIPENIDQKRHWISQELATLYLPSSSKQVPIFPQVNPAPNKGDEPSEPLHTSTVKIYSASSKGLPPLPPPIPPAPPAPPALPEPPAPPEPIEGNSETRLEAKNTNSSINVVDLYHRISLLDADKKYLAGQPLDQNARAARAIVLNGKTIAYLSISKPTLPSDTMARDFLQAQSDTVIFILLISIILSAIMAMLLARHFRQPIQQLVGGAKQLENGRFEVRLQETRSDELGELAHSFNQLAWKLQESERHRRQWVADTSHELRTPVSVIRAQLEALQDGIRPINTENLALLHRQIMSLNKLIDELYILAKADLGILTYSLETCDLAQLVKEVSINFQAKFDAAGLSFELELASDPMPLKGDIERLRQVLTNLLENAIRYTNSPGLVRVTLTKHETLASQLHLRIEDSMPGVADAALAQLGERFYRIDTSRSRDTGGAGLGLSLCKNIIEGHHGSLQFAQSVLGGLRVDVLLPTIV